VELQDELMTHLFFGTRHNWPFSFSR